MTIIGNAAWVYKRRVQPATLRAGTQNVESPIDTSGPKGVF